ncbi:MAG: preprotein translocase subunit YajC [Peptococcaceae bacterium]|nr:preprotein translocase subunit YajC [Peptococcaceae bacterium]
MDYISILYILALVGILYFMMIRPQQQRQKKQQEMIDSLRVSDRIVTVGGIYGSVVAIKDNTFIIKIAEDVQVELQRSAVGQKIDDDDDDDDE